MSNARTPASRRQAAANPADEEAMGMPDEGDRAPANWRAALETLREIAGDAQASEGRTRYLWALTLEPDGAVATVQPLEQTAGSRGWSRPRPAVLARLAASETLEACDARVVAASFRTGPRLRRVVIDRAAAVMALVGHPHVVMARTPGQTVELVEGTPQMEVVRRGDRFQLKVMPAMRPTPSLDGYLSPDAAQEANALRHITVLPHGPGRLRVVRLTPAQARAAVLLAGGLSVPAEAHEALDTTLRNLSAHFDIQSDLVAGPREMPPETLLRAELAPLGAGLALRLAVTPLGPRGPRLAPGAGRVRLMVKHQGESLCTERDLPAELAHLRTIFEAVPMLVPLAPDDGELSWELPDPEIALAVLEGLGGLPDAVAIEWPRGKEVRLVHADIAQLGVRVVTENQWFRLEGELSVAEGLVRELDELLAWTRGAAGRFVPLGEGKYLALARSLRSRLADLAMLADGDASDERGIRIPAMAAPWLADVLAGADVDADSHFRERLARLARSQDRTWTTPVNLQAVLRPYQRDGFAWAMALADAGFGACLADDMGLGKTLQALAVLLERAAGGPALVIAPTSVCGNWALEAARFAPSLRVRIYGERIDAPGDVGDASAFASIDEIDEIDVGDGREDGDAAGAGSLAPSPDPTHGFAATRVTAGLPSGVPDGPDRDHRRALLAQAGPGDVVIVSYGLLQRAAEDFHAREWHTVVADEAQAFKNASAQRARAMFDLRAGFRLALSGTPVENRLAELWSVMRFCNPGLLGSLARFNERFAIPIERNQQRATQRLLHRLISPFVLRRTKAEVLDDLPPRTETILRIRPGPVEAAHYESLRRDALAEAERAQDAAGTARSAAAEPAAQAQARIHVLAQITRLRRAACDARLVTPEAPAEGSKLRALVELASELAENGHRMLVFSQFVDFLKLLRGGLEGAGLRCQYLDGGTPARDRTRRVAAFQAGEGDAFLISLKAGGFGLNLTAADYVIIADPWWNPAAEDQAMGRAHRIGQQRPVTVYRMIAADTLEERIMTLHRSKRELAEAVIDGNIGGKDGGTVEAKRGDPAGSQGRLQPAGIEDMMALIREGRGQMAGT